VIKHFTSIRRERAQPSVLFERAEPANRHNPQRLTDTRMYCIEQEFVSIIRDSVMRNTDAHFPAIRPPIA